MYLRDISIDVPYIEDTDTINKIVQQLGITYDEAIKYDYDTNFKSDIRFRFSLETRSTTSLFVRLLSKIKTKDCAKILIECVNGEARESISNCLGIYTVQYSIDYNVFFEKTDAEKQVITLNIIKESIYKIAKEMDWDLTPFNNAIQEVVNLNFINEFTWKKKVKNIDKTYTAEVFIEHNLHEINLYLCIRNKQGNLVEKKLIFTVLPDEYFYYNILGKLEWTSPNQVQLIDLLGNCVGEVVV